MKVIDLLNKIANKEELPKKIKLDDDIYTYSKRYDNWYTEDDICLLGTFLLYNLNYEIEIIEDIPKEDKKIAKLKVVKDNTNNLVKLVIDKETKLTISIVEATILDKVNEIIDRLNGDE